MTKKLQVQTAASLNGVVRRWKAVVPSDSNDLPEWENIVGIRVSKAGNVTWTQADGTDVAMAFGNFDQISGSFKRIKATGTDSDIGLFAGYGAP